MQSDKTILEIAGMVGYGNGSKFAGDFKEIMSVTPKEYRNIIVKTELFLTDQSRKRINDNIK